ncbi:MAG: fatty acid desaturase [Gammaproteobacteria bacterium]
MEYLFGLYPLPIWGYVLITLLAVHFSVMAVTLYLHRDQTHRGLDLHPIVRHLCRFWLWFTTAIVTKEWVAVHRKHHARCETPEDPHSPVIEGIGKVLREGAELYQHEARKPETQEKYGRGTPDDWLERNLYSRFPNLGIILMAVVDLALFGVVGITIWAVQMLAMPVLSAGVINGLGHWTGYRNFECDDAARNLTPVAFVCGGEELHNNHHAFPSSARFSAHKWEFDIGWMYICVLKAVGMAKVRRVMPTPELVPRKTGVDIDTVRAIIVNRMHVLRDYTRTVTLPVWKLEARRVSAESSERARKMWRDAKRALIRRPELLDERHQARLQQMLDDSAALKTVHEFRERLHSLWSGATVSNDKLLKQLRDWCKEAEETGIRSLEEFSVRLRQYQMPAVA